MSTIIGRMSSRVRQHDWLAVLIDLTILIAGVFLGIEAANWNEERQARQEERRYYTQLIDDLATDLRTLEVASERSRDHDRAAENVLAMLDAGLAAGSDPRRFAVDVHYAGFLFLPQPARRTYDELISTGNLGLLRNARAKREVAAYYARFAMDRQWDMLLREQQSDYWSATAGVVPRHVLQAALRGVLPRTDRAEAESYLHEARQRPGLKNLLIGMAAHQERVRRDSEDQAREARRLIRMLEPLAG